MVIMQVWCRHGDFWIRRQSETFVKGGGSICTFLQDTTSELIVHFSRGVSCSGRALWACPVLKVSWKNDETCVGDKKTLNKAFLELCGI